MKEEVWREQQRKRKAEQRDLASRRQAIAAERTYIALSQASAPEWAHGCERCEYGVIGMAHGNGPLPLFLMRAVLAERHVIEFCDCRAGMLAGDHARVVYAAILGGREKIAPHVMEAVEEWIERQSMPTFNGEKVER